MSLPLVPDLSAWRGTGGGSQGPSVVVMELEGPVWGDGHRQSPGTILCQVVLVPAPG